MALTMLDYFGQLPQGVQSTLFRDPWTCQAILRALTPLAQQYALRLAGAQGPLSAALVRSWAQPTPEAQTKHELAITHLGELGLLSRVTVSGGASSSSGGEGFTHFQLHKEFGAQLLNALRGGQAVGGGGGGGAADLAPDKNAPSLAQLEAHATRTWEMLLEAVLSPPPRPIALSLEGVSLQQLLREAGLLVGGPPDAEAYTMGPGARAFLLEPKYAQVWRLMLTYMQAADAGGARGQRDALLSFLMRLGFLEQGVDYAVDELSEAQRKVLADLVLLGLVYMRKLNSRRYYTTPLAVSLLSGAAHADGGAQRGFLIVETNFRLYAYTDSGLWAQVVREFATLEYQLPNLVVATLTRESVLRAVDAGVRPEQIISFLARNAHPLMAANTPVLPETVVHQIHLWAEERGRIAPVAGRLYENFASLALFDKVVQYARDIGAFEWCRREAAPARCALVVGDAYHQQLKAFLQKTRDALAAGRA